MPAKLFPCGVAQLTVLWLARTEPHTKAGREWGTAREGLFVDISGSGQSCCVPWHQAAWEGQVCIFEHKQPCHQLSWCLSRVSSAVCRWLHESIEMPIRGGRTLPPTAVFLVSLWKEGRSLSLTVSFLPNLQLVTVCNLKNMGASLLAGFMHCYWMCEAWQALSLLLSTPAHVAIFPNPIPSAVSH